MEFLEPLTMVRLDTGKIEGKDVLKTVRRIKHMKGLYLDEKAYKEMNCLLYTSDAADEG